MNACIIKAEEHARHHLPHWGRLLKRLDPDTDTDPDPDV